MRFGRLQAFMFLICLLVSSPLAAGPALLFETASGKVLYAEDADNQWHPASLTKIMTAYIAFEEIKSGRLALDSKITCSEVAFAQQPSKVGLPVGAELTVELALKALIIKSANDVAVMLAEAISGSEQAFVAKMNATAARLGMTRTKFSNPNGLPAPDQITTARDLAKLSRAVVSDFPEYAHYWAMPDMRLGKQRLGSHNGLLKTFEGADGLKTGFICDSGFNVVASANRDGHRLMAVILGEPTGRDRTLRAASLLEHGFQQYGWKTLFNSTSIDNMPIDAEAKGVTSVRSTVLSFECGTGRRLRAVKRNRKQKAAAAEASAKSKGNVSPAGQAAKPASNKAGGQEPAKKPKQAAAENAAPKAAKPAP